MKPTKTTIKSFIKNADNLFINVKSSFDGMTDMCEARRCFEALFPGVLTIPEYGFTKVAKTEDNIKNTLGIKGAWFVGSGRDYFTVYNENGFKGYAISNCCGHFILAIKKATQ